MVEDFFHGILCFIPLLFGSDILFSVIRIPLGEAVCNVFAKAENIHHVFSKLNASSKFLFQLLGRTDEMPFGNGELADSDEAVHLAGILISKQR